MSSRKKLVYTKKRLRFSNTRFGRFVHKHVTPRVRSLWRKCRSRENKGA